MSEMMENFHAGNEFMRANNLTKGQWIYIYLSHDFAN